MFHHFYDGFHPAGQGAISQNDFSNLIEFIGPDRILGAQEWFTRHDSGELRPGDLCITFDDGLKCQFDVAIPVLREFGLTAFFFVYTGILTGEAYHLEFYRFFRTVAFASVDDFYDAFLIALDKSEHGQRAKEALVGFIPANHLSIHTFYSDRDRIFRYLRDNVLGQANYFRLMDDMTASYGYVCDDEMRSKLWLNQQDLVQLFNEGHVIGLHSHTHPTLLKALPLKVQESEYTVNREILGEVLGATPVCMSHPTNSYTEGTLEILRRLGIRLGFRTNMLDGFHSGLESRREDHANLMEELRLDRPIPSQP